MTNIELNLKKELKMAEWLVLNLAEGLKLLNLQTTPLDIDKSYTDNDGEECIALNVGNFITVIITFRMCTTGVTILGKQEQYTMVFDLHMIKTYHNYPSAPDEDDIDPVAFDTCTRQMDVVQSVIRKIREYDEQGVIDYLMTQKIGE